MVLRKNGSMRTVYCKNSFVKYSRGWGEGFVVSYRVRRDVFLCSRPRDQPRAWFVFSLGVAWCGVVWCLFGERWLFPNTRTQTNQHKTSLQQMVSVCASSFPPGPRRVCQGAQTIASDLAVTKWAVGSVDHGRQAWYGVAGG